MTTTESEILQFNSANEKLILFLDLDGPVIDLYTYRTSPHVSYLRLGGNSHAIKNIVKLCLEFDLKIVTNSRHNHTDVGKRQLRDDLISWGIPAELFHPDWRTTLDEVPYNEMRSQAERCADRMNAITEWLNEHPGHEWICFDDRKFTNNFRLINIQRDAGVDDDYYTEAFNVVSRLLNLEEVDI